MTAPTGPDKPTVDIESAAWWDAVQDQRLTVSTCRSCQRNSLYARPFCPHCWSEDVELTSASGRARLYTWTVIHQNAAPFADRTPYVVAMVDLEEGPRLMTELQDCRIDDLESDMELMVAFRVNDGFTVPVFTPARKELI